MKCPNCKIGTLGYVSEAVAICDSCGYIVEPRVWGLEKPDVPHIHKPDVWDRLEFAIAKLLAGLGMGS